MPQSDINIFYNIYKWLNVHKWCILQIIKHDVGQIRNWRILVAISDAS